MKPASDIKPDQFSWEVTATPAPEEAALIDDRLDSFNAATAPMKDVRPLACFARLPDGKVAGGAIARTWGECCELQQIWVDEPNRRSGIGRRLLQLVEQEARKRGCALLYLETFSFQSPEFYRRLGFESVCELGGFPNGITKHILRKCLA